MVTQNSNSDRSVPDTSLLKSGDISPSRSLPRPYLSLGAKSQGWGLVAAKFSFALFVSSSVGSVSSPLTKGTLQAEFLLYCSKQVGLFEPPRSFAEEIPDIHAVIYLQPLHVP